ncbi:MAG: hypothetical protein ACM34E_14215, partial [Acidobacteriota bacterium]
ASGWMAACAAYFAMHPSTGRKITAAAGALIGLAMIFMKIMPALPGHFSVYEWLALAAWIVLGGFLYWRAKSSVASPSNSASSGETA